MFTLDYPQILKMLTKDHVNEFVLAYVLTVEKVMKS